MAIMGVSRYRVTKGHILFQGQAITCLPGYERAYLTIGLMHQRPRLHADRSAGPSGDLDQARPANLVAKAELSLLKGSRR